MIDNTFFTKFLPTACSTLILSLGLSATRGKGDRLIFWDEFYRMRLVMDSTASEELIRTSVLIEVKSVGSFDYTALG
ncbi:MAG: hypothetical protein V7L04_18980 [Nostoc sp.]|uniref:hypothetical protein n=1 Tax=Nostoc sp. TaxID=1180 RepID=UPI002FFBDE4C